MTNSKAKAVSKSYNSYTDRSEEQLSLANILISFVEVP